MRNINLRYVEETYAKDKTLQSFSLHYPDTFNFGYDIVDDIAVNDPTRRAMVWCNPEGEEHVFTFADMKTWSDKTANFLKSLGIGKGDMVMVIVRRHYQFWFIATALAKLGAIMVPATFMLKEHDLEYRLNNSEAKAIIATSVGDIADIIDNVRENCPSVESFVLVNGAGGGTTGLTGDGERDVDQALNNLRIAQADDFELSQSIAQVSGETDSLREEVGRLEQTITGQLQEKGQIQERRARIAEDTAASRAKVEELAARKDELAAHKAELDERVAAARDKSAALATREEGFTREISTIRVDLATVRERERHLGKQIRSLGDEIAQLEETLKVSHETESNLEILRLRVEPLYDVFTNLREGVQEKAEVLRDRAQIEQAGQGDLRDTIDKAREAVDAEQAKLDEANEKLTQVRIEKSKLEVKVEAAIAVITETHGVLLDIALALDPPENRDEEERRAESLRRKLGNLGSVNPVAVEEYRKLRERREFISVQLEDLEAAAKALQRIVAAIDRKMRNRFVDTFEQVNANFEEVFAQLFPGGNGHLELTDPDNPEETGVEVYAQPRGKKVRKQTLLSGGEQSLVALALLFAVYRVRRTPFYILDEVEAALDDTNLRRLLSYLDSIRSSTQFIIISHQRRTMEMADLLYGVSMRSDGVSKLVSQKLDQQIRLSTEDSGQTRDVEEFSGAR